jgi:hypothetical protein
MGATKEATARRPLGFSASGPLWQAPVPADARARMRSAGVTGCWQPPTFPMSP